MPDSASNSAITTPMWPSQAVRDSNLDAIARSARHLVQVLAVPLKPTIDSLAAVDWSMDDSGALRAALERLADCADKAKSQGGILLTD
jgi:hypothetical protein